MKLIRAGRTKSFFKINGMVSVHCV